MIINPFPIARAVQDDNEVLRQRRQARAQEEAYANYLLANQPRNELVDIPAQYADNPAYKEPEPFKAPDFINGDQSLQGNELLARPQEKQVMTAPARQQMQQRFPQQFTPVGANLNQPQGSAQATGALMGQLRANDFLEQQKQQREQLALRNLTAMTSQLLPQMIESGQNEQKDMIAEMYLKNPNESAQQMGQFLKNWKITAPNEGELELDGTVDSMKAAYHLVPSLQKAFNGASPEEAAQAYKVPTMLAYKIDSFGNTTTKTKQLKATAAGKSVNTYPINKETVGQLLAVLDDPKDILTVRTAPMDGKHQLKVTWRDTGKPSVEIIKDSAVSVGGRENQRYVQSKWVPGAAFDKKTGRQVFTYTNENGVEVTKPLDSFNVQEQARYWPAELAKAKQRGGVRAASAYVAADTYQSEANELKAIRDRIKEKNPGLLNGVGSKIRKINSLAQLTKTNFGDDPDLAEFMKGTTLLADVLQNAVGGAQGGQWAFELASKLLDPSLPDTAYEATINKHMRTLYEKAGNYAGIGASGTAGYQPQPAMKGMPLPLPPPAPEKKKGKTGKPQREYNGKKVVGINKAERKVKLEDGTILDY